MMKSRGTLRSKENLNTRQKEGGENAQVQKTLRFNWTGVIRENQAMTAYQRQVGILAQRLQV